MDNDLNVSNSLINFVAGQVIRDLRLKQGRTQKSMREAINMGASSWSHMENGRTQISVYLISRVAQELRMDPCEIYRIINRLSVYMATLPPMNHNHKAKIIQARLSL